MPNDANCESKGPKRTQVDHVAISLSCDICFCRPPWLHHTPHQTYPSHSRAYRDIVNDAPTSATVEFKFVAFRSNQTHECTRVRFARCGYNRLSRGWSGDSCSWGFGGAGLFSPVCRGLCVMGSKPSRRPTLHLTLPKQKQQQQQQHTFARPKIHGFGREGVVCRVPQRMTVEAG